MPRIRTDDGVELHYRLDDFRDPWLSDAGETILMHHGFARNMKWWIQWVPPLSRKYRVLRYDVRGCGESSVPPPDADWSAGRLVKDALEILNQLDIDRVHWVGFHSGALVGQMFAVTYPDRIKSLVLVNGPSGLSPQNREITSLGEKDSSAALEKHGLREWLKRTTPVRLDLAKADPWLVEWHTNEQAKTPFHAAYALLRTFHGIDFAGMLPKILVPTLLIAGDRSPICPLDQQRFMQQQIPNCKLVVLEGIGEGIFLLMADRCIEETLRFLETV